MPAHELHVGGHRHIDSGEPADIGGEVLVPQCRYRLIYIDTLAYDIVLRVILAGR